MWKMERIMEREESERETICDVAAQSGMRRRSSDMHVRVVIVRLQSQRVAETGALCDVGSVTRHAWCERRRM
jgi:hypothetical protein